jgi:hypothetical protein
MERDRRIQDLQRNYEKDRETMRAKIQEIENRAKEAD